MRVLLHTGKGGVGKTTLSLATAIGAARHGHRVCILSTDAAHSLGDALGRPVGSAAVEICPGVVAREIGVLDELDRSWGAIQRWLRALLREGVDEMVAEELLVFPGLEELISLRVIREVEETGEYDVCVVDCAPTGATLRMLRFPDALRIFMEHFFDLERRGARLLRPLMQRLGATDILPADEFFDAFERLHDDVEAVRQILLDDARTSARLVVNPARVVVDEARRSFAYLSLYGVATDAVLVNRLLPETASGGYFARWAVREREELDRIRESFPVPILAAPLCAREPIGVDALAVLGDSLFARSDPAAFFSAGRPIRLARRRGRTIMEIDLPGVSKEEIEVLLAGDELHLRVRDARRRLSLPESLQGRAIGRVKLHGGVLELWFAD